MDDPLDVRVVEGFGDRLQDAQRLGDVEPAPLLERRLERDALEVLHHEVIVAHVEHVTMPGCPRLPAAWASRRNRFEYSSPCVAREVFGLQRLDGHDALRQRVEGAIDPAHRTLADQPADLVASEPVRQRWDGGGGG